MPSAATEETAPRSLTRPKQILRTMLFVFGSYCALGAAYSIVRIIVDIDDVSDSKALMTYSLPQHPPFLTKHKINLFNPNPFVDTELLIAENRLADLRALDAIQKSIFTYSLSTSTYESFLQKGESGTWVPFFGGAWHHMCRNMADSTDGGIVLNTGTRAQTFYSDLLVDIRRHPLGAVAAYDEYSLARHRDDFWSNPAYNAEEYVELVRSSQTRVIFLAAIINALIAGFSAFLLLLAFRRLARIRTQ